MNSKDKPAHTLRVVLNRQRTLRVATEPLQEFLESICAELNLGDAEITVALVSDREITKMNATFRGKNKPTDVLSFPAATALSGKKRKTGKIARSEFLGDIAISPATAKRNAKKYGRTLPDELHILILHGVLHLLGYDHETDNGRMDRMEAKLRRRLRLV